MDHGGAAPRLIRDPRVLLAARTMNLWLVPKGRTPYGQYHRHDLADHLVS